jgi:hypothetical protein
MSLMMKYFVLKPKGGTVHAAASRRAMRAYADWLDQHEPSADDAELANGLRDWADREAADVAPKFGLSDERGQY